MSSLHALLAIVCLSVGNLSLTVPVYASTLNVTTDSDAWKLEPSDAEEVGRLAITWLVALFFSISSFFHLGNGLLWREYYLSRLEACLCPSRWIEYSFSASVMVLLIAYFSGTLFLSTLISLFGLSFVTMLFGYASELYNRPSSPTEWEKGSFWSRAEVHFLGYPGYTLLWVVLFFQFVRSAIEAGDKMPPFVWGVVIGQCFLFSSFILPQLYQLRSPPSSYVKGELAFQVLSLGSKAMLGGLFLGNVLRLKDATELFA